MKISSLVDLLDYPMSFDCLLSREDVWTHSLVQLAKLSTEAVKRLRSSEKLAASFAVSWVAWVSITKARWLERFDSESMAISVLQSTWSLGGLLRRKKHLKCLRYDASELSCLEPSSEIADSHADAEQSDC